MGAAAREREIARLRGIERNLVWIRWLGVAFGLFQVWQLAGPGTPDYLVPISYQTVAALGVGNAIIAALSVRATTVEGLRRIGYAAFALDVAMVFANVWLGSYDRNSTSWTLAYVLPLEGAIRYQMRGAVWMIGVFSISETIREIYRTNIIAGLGFEISAVTYRVGLFAIIALIAGIMARNLQSERSAAESRADELDRMARREMAGRTEIQAFHDVVLAGIGSGTVEQTVASISSAMGKAFGWEAFAVGLIDEETNDVRLTGSYGPGRVIDHVMPAGRGIVGRAIGTGESQLVANTRSDPDYVEWSDHVRSEMTTPIFVENKIIGVVDVESRRPSHFTPDDVESLERLAGQIGLVVSNARLLAAQRAMVARLQELDTMKSDFVAVTSHELRTPLTAVQGFIRTLRRPDVRLSPGEMEEFLAIVDRQVERLSRLVEELLLTARIDAGTIDLQMDSVEVSEVLEETLSELGDGRTRVQLAIDPTLPRVVTDAQRLGQIARNLIENALKFSPDDRPVRVTVVRNGSSLQLDVADKGSGIADDEVAQIFDRFHQVGGSLRRRGQGLGLGLYIVRNLVDALNGTVAVRSTPGEGSVFSVSLPLVPAAARSSTA